MMAAAGGRNSFFFFGKGGGVGGGGNNRVNPVISSSDVAELELEESDVWNFTDVGSVLSDHHTSAGRRSSTTNNYGSLRGLKKGSRKRISGITAHFAGERASVNMAASLPVNIPDWSRILGEEYRENKREIEDDVDDDGDGAGDHEDDYGRLPPHEYLARVRGSSFSVHEGVGRTLKGRDLSRVRNAVWKQTGFED